MSDHRNSSWVVSCERPVHAAPEAYRVRNVRAPLRSPTDGGLNVIINKGANFENGCFCQFDLGVLHSPVAGAVNELICLVSCGRVPTQMVLATQLALPQECAASCSGEAAGP